MHEAGGQCMRDLLSATERLLCAPCIPIPEMYPWLVLQYECIVAVAVCGVLIPGPPTDTHRYMWMIKILEWCLYRT